MHPVKDGFFRADPHPAVGRIRRDDEDRILCQCIIIFMEHNGQVSCFHCDQIEERNTFSGTVFVAGTVGGVPGITKMRIWRYCKIDIGHLCIPPV